MKKINILLVLILAASFLSADNIENLSATYMGNDNTWEITLIINKATTVVLSVWYPDEKGEYTQIRVLYDKPLEAGTYTFFWDGKNNQGVPVKYIAKQKVIYRNGKVLLLK
ncbi:MAG TPA: hypothetical protein PLD62_11465 [Candidatus Cloacimonadota bacterium]|nr:hypothetical protein [Candidatus Cloacimonadota bacterium]